MTRVFQTCILYKIPWINAIPNCHNYELFHSVSIQFILMDLNPQMLLLYLNRCFNTSAGQGIGYWDNYFEKGWKNGSCPETNAPGARWQGNIGTEMKGKLTEACTIGRCTFISQPQRRQINIYRSPVHLWEITTHRYLKQSISIFSLPRTQYSHS